MFLSETHSTVKLRTNVKTKIYVTYKPSKSIVKQFGQKIKYVKASNLTLGSVILSVCCPIYPFFMKYEELDSV